MSKTYKDRSSKYKYSDDDAYISKPKKKVKYHNPWGDLIEPYISDKARDSNESSRFRREK